MRPVESPVHSGPAEAAPTDAPMLTMSGITKAFGDTQVLQDVELTVEEGSAVFLLGPSGCGKTTLLRIIAGLITPDTGSLMLDGRNITAVNATRRPIGMVFQSYALFPHMTVRENLEFGLRAQKQPKKSFAERVRNALRLVELDAVGNRYPRELSGGQQQRVALARTLVTEPRLMLLDEPLSNLDARLKRTMQIELRNLQRRIGITTIYVTHDQDEAQAMADKIVVMNAGRIEQVSQPRHAYAYPETRFVASFLGDANFITGDVTDPRPGSVVLKAREDLVLNSSQPDLVVETGRRMTAMIRPERITMTPSPVKSSTLQENAVDARVRDLVFSNGATIAYCVDDSGHMWQTRYIAGVTEFRADDQVRLSWRSQDVALIKETAE